MVLIGQAIRTGIQIASRYTNFGKVGQYQRAFTRYDKQIHSRAFGRSGGRGFRHGRDAGLALSGLISQSGDDLDRGTVQPGYQASSKFKTRGGRSNKYSSSRKKRCTCHRGRSGIASGKRY